MQCSPFLQGTELLSLLPKLLIPVLQLHPQSLELARMLGCNFIRAFRRAFFLRQHLTYRTAALGNDPSTPCSRKAAATGQLVCAGFECQGRVASYTWAEVVMTFLSWSISACAARTRTLFRLASVSC